MDDKSTIEGLPLIGTEQVNLTFEDNKENKIKLQLYVNKVTPITQDTRKISLKLIWYQKNTY